MWKDIQSVYEPYLARHPESRYDKTCYARLAALGGHFAESKKLFDELGDNWFRSVFPGGDQEYHWLRDDAPSGVAGPAQPRTRSPKAPAMQRPSRAAP